MMPRVGHGGRARIVIAFLAVTTTVAGCGGADDPGRPGAAGDDRSVDTSAVLRVGTSLTSTGRPDVLDPRYSTSNDDLEHMQAIYSTMATVDPETGEYAPNLAESWNVVDAQTVEVTLRPDADFHDGTPVTSADVAATIDSMKANQSAGTNTADPSIQLITEIEQVDEKNFVVHMSAPGVAALLEMFVDRPFMIVPASVGEGEMAEPVGTGPFTFSSYTVGERILVERWDDHFLADDVMLAGIEFIHVPETEARTNALLAGDIDYGEVGPAGADAVESAGLVSSPQFSDGQILYLDMCKDHGTAFEDLALRRAVAHAIDKEAIDQAVYDGDGQIASQIWPEDSEEYDDDLGEPYPYDPDRARDLLDEAGIPEGTTISVYALSRVAEFEQAALLIRQQLAEVGLELEITGGDDIIGQYYQPASTGNPAFDGMVSRSQSSGVRKAARWFRPGILTNTCGWEDPELVGFVDELAGAQPGSEEALEAWAGLAENFAENAVYVPLIFEPKYMAWSDRVDDMEDALVFPSLSNGPRWELVTISG